jgi:hypothetical protein
MYPLLQVHLALRAPTDFNPPFALLAQQFWLQGDNG